MTPRVSVVLPVYNADRYLAEAIESILTQTWYDFEFIIIDDGSRDKSLPIIEKYAAQDQRIRFIAQTNMGQSATLNRGLATAQGEYIAIMHADDISLPTRLATQVQFMDTHSEIGLCGTWAESFGVEEHVQRVPTESQEIACKLVFRNCIIHPSVMLRRTWFTQYQLQYDTTTNTTITQDYLLWTQAAQHFACANIPQVLVKYRLHEAQASYLERSREKQQVSQIQTSLLAQLGVFPTENDLAWHYALGIGIYPSERQFMAWASAWLWQLVQANRKVGKYPVPVFEAVVSELWDKVCLWAVAQGYSGLWIAANSPLRRLATPTRQWQQFKTYLKTWMRGKHP